MNSMHYLGLSLLIATAIPTNSQAQTGPIGTDTTTAYTMPLLTKTPTGAVMLTWSEKDAKGNGSFCMAQSADKGKTFSPKQVVYAGPGVNGSRLMRPKVMFKKDGSMVAVFPNGGNVDGKRTLQVMATTSTDKGMTWSAPKAVDSDPTPCVRGFFDAVMLPNDELAVAYLKDVAGSTKHEERNLRLVLTKNGAFQPERIIDDVVCDCCNISLLVDASGALQVYYRDNNDDIRDMAKMTSTDNGLTFSKPKIIFTDNWKIAGCPHSGATSTIYGKSNLITWFSGAETDKGIRLVTQEGKRLVLSNDPTARNGYVATQDQKAVFLWDQTNGNSPQIAYRTIDGDKVSATNWLNGSSNGINPSALVLDNQLLIAYEVRNANRKNGIKWSLVSLAAN